MADQQTPSNKRPRGETPPPSPSKARRLDDSVDITSAPVSPPDSMNGIEDSSLVRPNQSESASNSSTTAAISKSASTTTAQPIPPPRVPTKPLSEMTREELMELHDPIRCAEIDRTSKESEQRVQKMMEGFYKLSSAEEREQWYIDFCRKHGIPGPKPGPPICYEDVIDSIHYESDENEE